MARAGYHMSLQKGVSIMIVLLLLQLKWWSSHGCLEEERAALLQLQHSFNYPNGTSRLLWGTNIDCCNWYGVGCDVTTGRVNELYLFNFRDKSLGKWNFNASVFLPFQQLRSLDLSFNDIVCCVEKEGFEGLQRLSNLEALDLSGNRLTNNVLPMFQGFHSLKNLSLAFTKLNGLIYMKDLVNITNLEMLDLSYNNIEKFVSFEDIQSSSNISILWLSGVLCNGSNFVLQSLSAFDGDCNGRSFELQSLKAFENLKSLHLKYNNFKGVLFPQDGLNKLEELFLDDSDTDENFLLSLGGLRSLRLLSLEHIHYETCNNQSFLNSVANITSLESLILSRCELTSNIDGLCKLKNLQRLDLQSNNMKGILPPCLAKLTLLQDLDLSHNYFTENIFASALKNLNIQHLCKLKNLRRLDLGSNNMSGTLPPCLANLTLLQYMDLSSNYFTGNISASPLKSLTSIEFLSISYNQFQIPISLSPFLNHSKLKYLHANENEVYAESGGVDNNLTPKFQFEELGLFSENGEGGVSFPKFLYHQYDLRSLNLFGIQMRGVGFPSWLLDNNTNLGSLYLGNCSLSGTLHLPIHPHPKLVSLNISGNQFYGHIPKEIGRYFPMLDELYLAENDFIGKIPNSLSNCSLLQYLDLSYNSLFGKIPEWIGNMSSLGVLDLSNNNLFGSLPSIFIPPQAKHIYLSHNKLEGPFPNILPNSDVAILDLSHNCLTGSIPNSIKNWYNLKVVQLNHNNLEGEIPICLWKMMNELKFIDLSHNRFDTLSLKNDTFETPPSGSFLLYNGFLELEQKENTYQCHILRILDIGFIGLDLSSNNLSCSIPFEIGNKEGMKMLNLSRNNLIGHIPLSFSNMTAVESLDLSYNHLSGIFPPQLVQLKSLEVFSVAYNNISGKTPERVAQFATFEESSYRGNPFLCGLPLPKNCTPTESSMTKEGSTDDIDDGFIDMGIFQISFWVTFTIMLLGIVSILYINPYW